MERASEIAKLLLEINCLKLSPSDPFTYASGLKGPMYCDNRLLISYVKERTQVAQSFNDLCQELSLEFDQIAGLATAGIPHGAFLAHIMERPMVYVRSKPKEHGRGLSIEGSFKKGDKLLFVEDLVNQGSSLKKSVTAARNDGALVSDCLCIVDYQMAGAKTILEELDVRLHALTNFDAIAKTALSLEIINQKEYDLLLNWQKDPENWC